MADEENQEFSHKNSIQRALTDVLSHVAREAVTLLQYETFLAGDFPDIPRLAGGPSGTFDGRMNQVAEHLGGPPEFFIVQDGQEAPPGDGYPEATLREALSVFHRARKSVVRAHMFMAGSQWLADNPGLIGLPTDPEAVATIASVTSSAFWEHAEAAYIRLYSFWDRVGQVLDFSFFNIRKFDQNGFNAVMDRIASNIVPMNERLKASGSWKRLRAFQNSEKEDGLKWLLQRRNLVVHSIHLHPVEKDEGTILKTQFNHLDASHRARLRPQQPAKEVEILLGQLDRASLLFEDFLSLVEQSPSRKQEVWVRGG